ncbi:MAG: phosphatase PAP2 family protein [Oscillospiraceae bacterium]|nr:phosphatase PAP2 family protein [Oscillospiraceae bacterium]
MHSKHTNAPTVSPRFAPSVSYRGFRLRRINEPRFRHLWWLLFWPLYWLRYPVIEHMNPAERCHPIYCPLDDAIPFSEWFIIPYMLWMVCMVLLCLYLLFYDLEGFRRYSKFLLVSMSISTCVYLLYPSCQNLRPEVYPRENLLTDLVKILHVSDTNTNVFPSEHAIGSAAIFLAALRSKKLRAPLPLTLLTVFSVLTFLSTVFLKQHSVLDLIAALPVCAIAYFAAYRRKEHN